MLPVSLLNEPSDSSLIREKDDKFIARLEKEMLDNPIIILYTVAVGDLLTASACLALGSTNQGNLR